MRYINLMIFLISLLLTYIANPMLLNMLKNSGTTRENYRGEPIPISMGILFLLMQFLALGLILFIDKRKLTNITVYLFSITLMGLIGLLDDLIGDTKIKGFKGHIKAFFKGNLTTGGIKAGVGFLIAFFVSFALLDKPIEIIISTLTIALFTNLINLFDLRPGRAIKVFILISLLMLLLGNTTGYEFILFSFYGILFIYLPVDLKGKAMMGDIGSNILGMTLGIYSSLTHGTKSMSLYLVVLVLLHILAERVSFSKIIEKNKILKFIDHLGRER